MELEIRVTRRDWDSGFVKMGGLMVIIGENNTGKSTFLQYLLSVSEYMVTQNMQKSTMLLGSTLRWRGVVVGVGGVRMPYEALIDFGNTRLYRYQVIIGGRTFTILRRDGDIVVYDQERIFGAQLLGGAIPTLDTRLLREIGGDKTENLMQLALLLSQVNDDILVLRRLRDTRAFSYSGVLPYTSFIEWMGEYGVWMTLEQLKHGVGDGLMQKREVLGALYQFELTRGWGLVFQNPEVYLDQKTIITLARAMIAWSREHPNAVLLVETHSSAFADGLQEAYRIAAMATTGSVVLFQQKPNPVASQDLMGWGVRR